MLTRFDPFAELSRLEADMERMWGEVRASFAPAVDLYEDDEAVVVIADVPGMKSEDLDIQVEGDVLTLSGERRREFQLSDDGLQHVERAFGTFRRVFTLPARVDVAAIEASLDEGLLRLRLPKQSSAPRRRDETEP